MLLFLENSCSLELCPHDGSVLQLFTLPSTLTRHTLNIWLDVEHFISIHGEKKMPPVASFSIFDTYSGVAKTAISLDKPLNFTCFIAISDKLKKKNIPETIVIQRYRDTWEGSHANVVCKITWRLGDKIFLHVEKKNKIVKVKDK